MKGEQIDPIPAAAVDVPTPMFLWMKDFNVNSACALHMSYHSCCLGMILTRYELG